MTPSFRVTIVSRSVPPGKAATATRALHRVVRACNEGHGTTVVAIGRVRGNFARGIFWAVYVDPPGEHLAPSAEAVPHPVHLNWYAGFLSSWAHPFCTFGHSRGLPPLPVH